MAIRTRSVRTTLSRAETERRKALAIDYEFRMELDKNVNLGAVQAR